MKSKTKITEFRAILRNVVSVQTASLFAAFAVLMLLPSVAIGQSSWQEPTCDPSEDPTVCNVAAPINVSAAQQVKAGSLRVNQALQADGSLILSNGGTLNLPNNSVSDAMVVDTVTAGKFLRNTSASGTEVVDLDAWSPSTSITSETEVTGLLPGSAIADSWVDTIGDTMTGTLNINLNGLNSNQRGLRIALSGSERVAIEAVTSATYGVGIIADASAASQSIGISARAQSTAGNFVNTGSGGTAITATNSDGVAISATRDSGNGGATIQASFAGTLGYGVYGFVANDGYGVLGRTLGTGYFTYGVTGCANIDTNCGSLGGNLWAGSFDGDVYINDDLIVDTVREKHSQRISDEQGELLRLQFQYRPDQSTEFDWRNPIYIESNGSEVWTVVNNADNTLVDVARYSATTGQRLVSTQLNNSGAATAAVLSDSGLYIAMTNGDIYFWDAYDASDVSVLATTPATVTAMAVTDLYLFVGYSYGASNTAMISRIERQFGGITTTTNNLAERGYEVSDFVFANNSVYLYALVTVNDESTNTVKQEVWQMQTVINRLERVFPIEIDNPIAISAKDMTYDGSSLWVTASADSEYYEYLVKMHIIDETSFNQSPVVNQTAYQLNYQPIEDNHSDVNAIMYDGQYLWMTSDKRGMMLRVSPYFKELQSQYEPTLQPITYINYGTGGMRARNITNDGEYIWTLKQGTDGRVWMDKLSMGVFAKANDVVGTSGITLYNQNDSVKEPDPYCVYLDGAQGNATTLQVTPGVCQ